MIKKLATFSAAATIFAFSALSAFASGPAPGTGPWVACSDGDLTCALYIGSDLSTGGVFDCTAPNGKAGIGMLNINGGKAHCFAL